MAASPPPHWHKSIATIFYLVIAAAVGMAVVVSQRGVQIETDLQSISPSYIDDPAVEAAVNRLATELQQNLSLVLKSNSRERLEALLDAAPEILAQLNLQYLNYREPGGDLNSIVDIIEEYRFHLLTDEQLQDLQQQSDDEILQQARRQLYSLAGSARLFSLSADPLATANTYTLDLLERLPGSGREDVIAITNDGGEQYYAPLNFLLRPNAQDFNQQTAVQAEVTQIENALNRFAPDISILHSGVFFFSASAATSARADITLISIGSSAGILLLLLYFFRSARTILLPLTSIAVGIGFAFLACQLLFGAIHIFTIVFGASLIGVVIDYALHYAYHRGKERNLQQLRNLYRALLLSLMTSAIGYGALTLSGLAVLQQVAVFSVLGLVSAWLCVITLGSALLPKQQELHDDGLRNAITSALQIISRINGRVFAGIYGLALFAGLAVIVTLLTVSDSPRGFFQADSQLLAEEAELQEVVSNLEPATYLVIRGETEQAVYDHLQALWRQHPQQRDALFGAHTVMASPDQRQQAYQVNARLYDTDGLAPQFLRGLEVAPETIAQSVRAYQQARQSTPTAGELLGGDTLPTPPLWQQINQRQYGFFLLSRQADVNALNRFAENRDDVIFIDTVGMSTAAIQALRQSANLLLLGALALISGLILLRYRNINSLALMAVPLAAIVFTLAAFALSGVAVSLFHVMALFLVLGLGMDYVIFIADLQRHKRDTLCAVVLSAMTSLLAFGLLSLSQLPVVHAFGLTVLLGNSINLVGGFFLARFLVTPQQEPAT